jgi:methylenetetrahydrofolate reductase (NADPH)
VGKCRAGADFAITNMFFYPEDYLRLRVTERALELGGCRVPTQLWERLQVVAGDRSTVREIGVEYAAGMCERLLSEGMPALLHAQLVQATREIYQRLGLGERGRSDRAARSGNSAPSPRSVARCWE